MKIASFDWVVLIAAAGLMAAIGGLSLYGEKAGIGSEVAITSIEPANGSRPATTAPIKVQFGQAMNHTGVQSRWVMEPTVDGQFQWNGNTLLFIPSRPLLSGQTYTVSLLPGIETAAGGRASHALKWSFAPRSPGVIYLTVDPVDHQKHLRVINPGDKTSSELFAAPQNILDFAPSLDGQQVALSVLRQNGSSEIWLVNSPSSHQHLVINCPSGSCSNPIWSPDSKLLAYARNETSLNNVAGLDRIWLYDLTTQKTQPVYQDNQILGSHPVWSQNGRSLAFIDGNATGIRVIDLLSRKDYFVSSGFLGDAGSFSPDGTELAFTKLVYGSGPVASQIWLAHLGTDLTYTPLIKDTTGFFDNYPAWSPDGQWIAFLRRRADQPHTNQVTLYNQASGKLVAVTDEANYGDQIWNAAGQYLLIQKFTASPGTGSSQIMSYDVNSGHLTTVVDNATQGKWLP